MSSSPILHTLKRNLMHLRRRLYGLRAFFPGLRERHRLELMVGPLGFWDELQRYQIGLLRANGLLPCHKLLDIGCGPLQGGVAFIGYLGPHGYAGIDLNPVHVEAAKAQIVRHGLAEKCPQLEISSTFGNRELGDRTFDFIWASQILYYFNDDLMRELLRTVRQRLNPGGKFLGDVFALDHYEFKYPESPGKYIRHTQESLEKLAGEIGLQVRLLGTIEQFGYPKKLSLRTNLLFEFRV